MARASSGIRLAPNTIRIKSAIKMISVNPSDMLHLLFDYCRYEQLQNEIIPKHKLCYDCILCFSASRRAVS